MIKSELRKLLSVKSTYFLSALAIIFVVLLSWIMVWDLKNAVNIEVGNTSAQISEAPPEMSAEPAVAEAQKGEIDTTQFEAERQEWLSTRQREVIMNAFSTAASFIVIVVILQVIHEYRHNTIMYTISASRSRTRVFLSKIAVLLGFTVFMGLMAVIASFLTYLVAINYFDIDMPAQNLEWADAILRGSLYSVAFASMGAIIAFISRNVALAIAVFLIVPSTVESLLGIWLKQNTVYLPFSAMSQIVLYNPQGEGSLDLAHALITTAIYLAVLYPFTWFLFLRRDAN